MKIQKNETSSLKQIVRDGYCHILRDGKVKVEADGSVSGQVVFLKLCKKRHVLGMATLPFAGVLQQRGA